MDSLDARQQRDIVTVRYDEDSFSKRSGVCIIGSDSILGTRKSQQDSFYVGYGESQIILAVCDRMGGMQGGERASQTAVRLLAQDFSEEITDIPQFFRDEVKVLDDAVYSLSDETGNRLKAGTTIVSTVIRDNELFWLSAGDSRIYIIRDEEIVQVNRDHNYKLRLDVQLALGKIDEEEYQEKIVKGEALISFLGIGDIYLIDVNDDPFLLQDGDVVLLCSDGLYKRLDEGDILNVVRSKLPDVDAAAHELTRYATEIRDGSQDNTTVVLTQYNAG